jgi:hypothetical protein
MPGGEIQSRVQAREMTEERKFAILFAATILAARKLIDMDPNKPNTDTIRPSSLTFVAIILLTLSQYSFGGHFLWRIVRSIPAAQ